MVRSGCSVHYINAITGDVIVKKRNVNAYSQRSLLYKTVKEIYERDDVYKVKKRSIRLPVVDRSLREYETGGKECEHVDADNKEGGSSGEDSDEGLTLKQLKRKSKMKKRKRADAVSTYTELVCVKLEPVEEDPDLDNKPIINLKSKLPKAKRKRVEAVAKSAEVGVSSNPEKDLDTEMQHHLDTAVVTVLHHDKTGVPEPDAAPLLHDPQIIDLMDITATEVMPNQTLETLECENATPLDTAVVTVLHCDKTGVPEPDAAPLLDDPQIIDLMDITATEVMPNQTPETLESENATPLSFPEGYGIFVLNQISYDHLDNVEPFSQTKTSEETTDPSYAEKSWQILPTSEIETLDNIDLIPESELPTKNQSLEISEGSSIYTSSHELVEMSCNSSPDSEVPSLRAEDCFNSKEFNHSCDSWLLENNVKANISPEQELKYPTTPASGLSSSDIHFTCSGIDENLFSSQSHTTRVSNCLDTASSLVLPGKECSLAEQADGSVGEEINCFPSITNNEDASAQVSAPPPERLLLTRKVVSPSSQERVSLAMNSKEMHDQIDCKANTSFVKKGGDEASPVAKTLKDSGSVKQTKGTTSPSILKKLKNGKRRNSLPKGNLEGPRLSRSLQDFSTGCSSLEKCSESAIAFSKRQMQDIENLAMNLMGELKSMKDVMEGKFFSEVRQVSDLKREAEEVKEAITHASRAEETTRRWLSMMSRDCTRFCKIMSMKPSDSANNADTDTDGTNINVAAQTQREGKKIAFADEAGGSLCHVKYFDYDMKPKTDIKQEDETQ